MVSNIYGSLKPNNNLSNKWKATFCEAAKQAYRLPETVIKVAIHSQAGSQPPSSSHKNY